MEIEIIGAESLGVRGLCCYVKAGDRKILIDPGISLGYVRNGLSPHPAQIAVDEIVRERIINVWAKATDIVFSHFHGDHVPLTNANPYQLDVRSLLKPAETVHIWSKRPGCLSQTEKNRFDSLRGVFNSDWRFGKTNDGPVSLSDPVPHGEETPARETVMMCKIEKEKVFVHASDIQLLDDKTVSLIVSWKPDILIAGGPALYLGRLSHKQRDRAWNNALRLATSVDTLILDHHLLRSREGLKWLEDLSRKSGKMVLCAADFMESPRLLLEADRTSLYEQMPVPEGWHEMYAQGKANAKSFTRFSEQKQHIFKKGRGKETDSQIFTIIG